MTQNESHGLGLSLLADLIRIDTSNPPGGEEPACERVAEALRGAGLEPRLHRPAPGRANLTVRLRGTGALPPLLLHAHLDVVPADPAGWTHPPFSGALADGCVWGRGAVDMKHMAAMSAAVLCRLARERVPLKRDVILACVADEETGCELGSRWLVDHAPEEVQAGVALGEVGGASVRLAGRRIYPVQVAEKGTAALRLTAHGRAGHGSIPDRESAPLRLARAVAALGTGPLPTHATPAARAFLTAVLGTLSPGLRLAAPALSGDAGSRLLWRLGASKPLARTVNAMLANTVSPTILAAGRSVNVIPEIATADLDGRTLPGQSAADLVREVRDRVGNDVDLEVLREAPPVEAPLDHPFLETLRRVLARHDPGGRLVPTLTPGYTDAKAWSRLGAACYGFTPVRFPDDFPGVFSELFHGVDERIPVDGFTFGIDLLDDLVVRWAGKEEAT